MKKLLVLSLVMAAAGWASADVLWDQSNYNVDINSLVDQEFSDFPTYSSYMVSDVTTDPAGWNISAVTTYFTKSDGSTWGGITQARLNLFDRDAALPAASDDPAAGTLVDVTVTDLGDTFAIKADGLDIDVTGDIWVGLSPSASFADFGQEFHRAAPMVGDVETAWRNPGEAFGYGADWVVASTLDSGTPVEWGVNYEAAILIEGTVIPEPASLLLLGLAGLVLRRR